MTHPQAQAVYKEQKTVQPGYVFIVGLPRTGTTLLRSILNRSEAVGISMGEAMLFGTPRFFGLARREDFRKKLARVGNLARDEDLEKIVRFFYEQNQNNFWGAIPKSMDREDVRRRLLDSPQRERTLFDLAMVSGAQGKPLRGEKTPAHIYYVPTLLEWFPEAKIVHMFRDPRAVYASEKRKFEKKSLSFSSTLIRQSKILFELYASLDLISNWRRVIRLHHLYQEQYPEQYYSTRYEDLVRDPETELQRLCAFLGIEFSKAMLEPTVVNSSFVSRKHQVKGFDTSALDRWRQNIHPLINRWFIFWCKKQLLEFGYQP